mgnify:CR=1 FL=1
MIKPVNIYTDGACSGNQNEENIGGWGAVLEYGEHIKTIFGGEINTTNNRMEMLALLEALRCLKKDGLPIRIFSDSAYLVNCLTKKWYEKWRNNGWITANKTPVENKELWEELLKQIARHEKIHFYRIKGHLNLDKPTQLEKWYEKFLKANGTHFSKEEFLYIAKMNIEADSLANKGMDKQRKNG